MAAKITLENRDSMFSSSKVWSDKWIVCGISL